VPALHGMLTASVVGPEPVPVDWIVQAVLSGPDSEGNVDFQNSAGRQKKSQNCFSGLAGVLQQDPEMFRLLFCQPKLKEGDTTSRPSDLVPWFRRSHDVPSGGLGAASFDRFSGGCSDRHDGGSGRIGEKKMI